MLPFCWRFKTAAHCSMAQSGRLGKRELWRHIEKMTDKPPAAVTPPAPPVPPNPKPTGQGAAAPRETGGPKGPEPTRYGDWEVKGRCSDF